MKNATILFTLCILFAGCAETILEGPPMIASVELNTDSAVTHHGGKYKVFLKTEKGDYPIFYSDMLHSSGEVLTTMSGLESMQDGMEEMLRDTIEARDRKMEKLSEENESLRQELKEKNLLIRFLTRK